MLRCPRPSHARAGMLWCFVAASCTACKQVIYGHVMLGPLHLCARLAAGVHASWLRFNYPQLRLWDDESLVEGLRGLTPDGIAALRAFLQRWMQQHLISLMQQVQTPADEVQRVQEALPAVSEADLEGGGSDDDGLQGEQQQGSPVQRQQAQQAAQQEHVPPRAPQEQWPPQHGVWQGDGPATYSWAYMPALLQALGVSNMGAAWCVVEMALRAQPSASAWYVQAAQPLCGFVMATDQRDPVQKTGANPCPRRRWTLRLTAPRAGAGWCSSWQTRSGRRASQRPRCLARCGAATSRPPTRSGSCRWRRCQVQRSPSGRPPGPGRCSRRSSRGSPHLAQCCRWRCCTPAAQTQQAS